jgi:vacuolar-type H+-ATPase subunit I/STV1
MDARARIEDLVSYSDRLLERERRTLIQRIGDLTQRLELHRGIVEQLEADLATEERLLREVEELTDRRPQLRLERLDRQLRGRRLQEVAVEILRRRSEDDAIHYRDWFTLVRAQGWEVVGRDPLNTFLTEVGRADGVERVGRRTGMYRVAAS